ncbi:MAG TPA: ATP-binding cassette domain-containing protein [Acidimicrobiales bacterium]|nr:ATP-binding cassette domain-containing protein [Acidimicrobiales bacterium]
MSMLQLDKVSKVYKSGTFGGGLKQALRQVCFDIEAGEVVALIGESGSGKSTLGKIVLRLIPMSAGRVMFEGRDIGLLKKKELHDYYRRVQGVFQDPFSSYNPLYKAERVFEMLRQEYFSRLSKQEWLAKVDAALEAVTLNPHDVLNKFPHQLSGGQQQRMLVARALLLDVRLLVADEIISMLDASTRVDVLNMLVSLKKRGLGILFITHDLSLGNYISDRTVILRDGVVLEMGLTPKVFGDPQHSYTRRLLTAVPQLHRKWEQVGALTPLSTAPVNGSAQRSSTPHAPSSVPVATTVAGPEGPASSHYPAGEGESKRYSKSSVYPGRKAGQPDRPTGPAGASPIGSPSGSRPSLMDMPDQRWQRRLGRSSPHPETVLAAEAPPPLVEYEEGHFVAVEPDK